MSLVITPLTCDDVPAVKRLLIAGLAERWGIYEPQYNPVGATAGPSDG